MLFNVSCVKGAVFTPSSKEKRLLSLVNAPAIVAAHRTMVSSFAFLDVSAKVLPKRIIEAIKFGKLTL